MKAVFPHKFKIAGIVLIIAATCITVFFLIYEIGNSREVLSVFHTGAEAGIFKFQKNSFAGEMILLLFIAGFTLIVFSKEKKEFKFFQTVRMNALFKTIMVYTAWVALVILLTSGEKFLLLIVFNMVLPYIIYLAFFYFTKTRELKKRRLHKIQRKILKSIS